MADNLLDMAVRQLGSSGIGALSGALGLPEGKGETALNSGLSSVLAGMLNRGSSKTGLAGLFNMVTGATGLDLSSIGDVFRDPEQMNSLQKSGGNMLETVFGNKSSDVGNVLSNALGLSGGTGGSLLKVAAPIVMSLLGKLVKSKGLDIGGLANLLLGQKAHIKDKIPPGLLKELSVHDFEHLGEPLETQGHEQPQTIRPHGTQVKKRGGFGKWFWPLLIALGALYALNMCAKKEHVEDRPGEVILEEDQTTIESKKPDESMSQSGEAMSGQAMESEEAGDFATRFRDYLGNASRDPNREFPLTIQFEVDSAKVTDATVPDVDALAKILQENPGVTIAIEGHTSMEGDEVKNLQLSRERAEAVRQMLVDKGIDIERISATGMGSTKPIADNNTEEGKKKNRRISVRVVKFE
ncbi:OmpA family protein [Microbulbifer hainanensis]|uniref:OmpA family protein n=1 Tax=Microbulbifer hainanensis TaxID=2735675 RepID=UPI001867F7EA|nr:OmpA family protein [Microbulbifer hainanensis]